jgi:hypothetical protein
MNNGGAHEHNVEGETIIEISCWQRDTMALCLFYLSSCSQSTEP